MEGTQEFHPARPKSDKKPIHSTLRGAETWRVRERQFLAEKALPVDIPTWIKTAVSQTVQFARKEDAARFIGKPVDFDHGHLIVPTAYAQASAQAQLDHSTAILFHTQEHLNSEHYGMDRRKRNILYVRKTGKPELLDLNYYPHTQHGLAIYAEDVCKVDKDRLGDVAPGHGIFFSPRAEAEDAFTIFTVGDVSHLHKKAGFDRLAQTLGLDKPSQVALPADATASLKK